MIPDALFWDLFHLAYTCVPKVFFFLLGCCFIDAWQQMHRGPWVGEIIGLNVSVIKSKCQNRRQQKRQ